MTSSLQPLLTTKKSSGLAPPSSVSNWPEASPMLVIVTVWIGDPMPTATWPKSTGLGSAVSETFPGAAVELVVVVERTGGGIWPATVVVVPGTVVVVVAGGVNDDA